MTIRPEGESTATRIREASSRDRRALAALGHPPNVLVLVSPNVPTRVAWAISGMRARTFVADAEETGRLLGSVQLVRSRLERATWMFGHWRVPADRRREGIGGEILRQALRFIPGARRLYSVVENENRNSLQAHARLEFESAPEALGRARLGTLATLGPPAPSVRLTTVPWRDRQTLFDLYRRSTGSLWMRLHPGLQPQGFAQATIEPIEGPPAGRARWRSRRARLVGVDADGRRAAFLARSEGRIIVHVDPEACDAGLLARIAGQLIAGGVGREDWIDIRGLPRSLLREQGPISGRILLGMADLSRLRG